LTSLIGRAVDRVQEALAVGCNHRKNGSLDGELFENYLQKLAHLDSYWPQKTSKEFHAK
jgi:hypothetical protein